MGYNHLSTHLWRFCVIRSLLGWLKGISHIMRDSSTQTTLSLTWWISIFLVLAWIWRSGSVLTQFSTFSFGTLLALQSPFKHLAPLSRKQHCQSRPLLQLSQKSAPSRYPQQIQVLQNLQQSKRISNPLTNPSCAKLEGVIARYNLSRSRLAKLVKF